MKQMSNLIFICLVNFATSQQSDFSALSFKTADSIALAYKGEGLTNIDFLAKILTINLPSEVEKFRSIYKWVTTNISHDFYLTHLNKAKQNSYRNDPIKLKAWNTKISKKLFKQLLKRKSTICTGYAYMIKTMCDAIGLKSEIIHGYGRLTFTDIDNFKYPNHSWNAVKLNNKWYLVDATWASGKQDEDSLQFKFDYTDGYFLTHPDLFVLNHYPLNKEWLLLKAENLTFQEFLKSPIVYKNGFNYLEKIIHPKQLHLDVLKNNPVNFSLQFKQPVSKKEVSLKVDSGYGTKTVVPKLNTRHHNHVVISYTFKEKGSYDIHLIYKNQYMATYTVIVK